MCYAAVTRNLNLAFIVRAHGLDYGSTFCPAVRAPHSSSHVTALGDEQDLLPWIREAFGDDFVEASR